MSDILESRPTHIAQPDEAPATMGPRDRRGIALAVAIMSIVFVGALVASAMFFTTQNKRVADNARRQLGAYGVAERGVAEVVRSWNANVYNVRPIYPLDSMRVDSTADTSSVGTYRGYMYHLNQQLFLLDLSATDSMSASRKLATSGARQRVGLLTRIVPLTLPASAALTIANPVIFGGGNSIVQGADAVPAGWTSNCPPAGAAVAGVHAKAPGDIQGSAGQYTGNPNSLITPGMDSMVYTQFGNTTYGQLAQGATFRLNPGTYSPSPVVNTGVCVTSNSTNWGDGANPTAPCGSFFPVIYIAGARTSVTTLSSGQGQGMLLVDGDLVVSGTWTFYGVVMVRGTFKTTGVGAPKVYGTVLANRVDFSSTSAGSAAAVINYSSCSIDRTMNATSPANPLRSRSYVRMM